MDLYLHGLFQNRKTKGEIGSSAMPIKVNPIDFENAEGNWDWLMRFLHLAAKLPISRLQRDLTDSNCIAQYRCSLSHTIPALKSIEKATG